MVVESVFAVGYVVCSATAILAHVADRSTATATAGNFWLRVASITALFAVLRYASLHVYLERAVRNAAHAEPFLNSLHPGQIAVLLTLVAFGLALGGLFLFKKKLPKSVFIAAISLFVLIMLAIIHSASLYVTGAVLQAKIGPTTISRVIEATALFLLATSGLAFAKMSPSTAPI